MHFKPLRVLDRAVLLALLTLPSSLRAQQPAQVGVELPEAPSVQRAKEGEPASRVQAGIRQPPSGESDPWLPVKPQTAAQKFGFATQSSFSYPSLLFSAAGAGIAQGLDYYPEFGQGGAGYGRYLWHGFADQTVNAYLTEFTLPVLLHQDTRYYRLGRGRVWPRTVYALSRMVVTRSDQGVEQINTSEILGSGMAASISSTFYPERERTFSIVGQRWAANLEGDALGMLFKEFSPEIGSALGNVVHFRKPWKSLSGDSIPKQAPKLP